MKGDGTRVLHVIDSMTGGGAQQVLLDLVSWSAQAGIPAAVIGAEGARAADLPFSATFFPVASRQFSGYLAALVAACRRFRPTILHAHQRREALACMIVGAIFRIPVVEHAHTVLPKPRLRHLSFRSRRVFSVGPAVTRMLIERFGVPEDRIVTIGNLVPATGFIPSDASVERSNDLVLGIGRLEEQKNPERFTDIVGAACGAFRGEWLGDGPLRDEVAERARRTGAPVEFRGRSSTVAAEMDRAGALLLTSRWEGTPLVVLEAFARGLLVIAVEAPDVTELVAGRGF